MNKFSWPEASGQSAFPVASAGYSYIFVSGFTTLVFALLEMPIPAIICLLITFFICFFFRDPDRVTPAFEGIIVSPADGKVIAVKTVSGSPLFDGDCQKISIFMSIFNVHVNRIPQDGVIKKIDYHPGAYFSANLDKASDKNERNAILLETGDGKRICFVQIAGLVARRIISRVQPGDNVIRGQRFGLICFGSRLDVYIPLDSKPRVAKGDKVQAGTTILGEL